MSQWLSGPGVPLPLPQNLYPSELFNAPYDYGTAYLALAAGQEIPIPAGIWLYDNGDFTIVEVQDPLTNIWRGSARSMATRTGLEYIRSDGFTRRLANRLGCPIGAQVTGGGSSFVQATATLTAPLGGSTWQALVGGSLSVVSISNAGSLFTVPPLVVLPDPPPGANNANGIGGIPATAYAVLTSNTVSGVTLVDVGAGYPNVQFNTPNLAAGQLILLPNPTDPNFGSIVNATVYFQLANAGKITAALCTNPGAPLPSMTGLPSLVAAGGAGTGATVVPLILQTATSVQLNTAGFNVATASFAALITSVGGIPNTTSAITNPSTDFAGFTPRPLQAAGIGGGVSIASVTVYDSGLFVGGLPASPVIALPGFSLGVATMASLTFVMGTTIDLIRLQPL